MTLPISAILPIFNCRERLESHFKSVQTWVDSVEEIIVVDSGSTDGTLELARKILSPFNARFLNHPPGLYQSWNAGIAAAKSTWCYISTVEDPITLEGLKHLLEVITRHDADVVISPPEMRNHDGSAPADEKMPANRLAISLEKLGITEHVFSRTETIALFCGCLPSGILGSSASNLYRTDFLQQHPFPTDFGHCGDTAWGLRAAPVLKGVFTTQSCARFYLQTKHPAINPAKQLQRHRQFAALTHASLQTAALTDVESAVMLAWFDSHAHSMDATLDWLLREQVYQNQLNELRTKYEGGILQYLKRSFRDEWRKLRMK